MIKKIIAKRSHTSYVVAGKKGAKTRTHASYVTAGKKGAITRKSNIN